MSRTPSPIFKHSRDELTSTYDFIVVGDGIAGLTVAKRLSENSEHTVLVIEHGYLTNGPCVDVPSFSLEDGPGLPGCGRLNYNDTISPKSELDNAAPVFYSGAGVGGSSAITGMVFHHAAKADYDAWEQLGNPEWGYHGLLPYFKRSTSWTAPSHEVSNKCGYAWDSSALGDQGPIEVSFPPFQWPSTKLLWDAWGYVGITEPVESVNAEKRSVGRFWVPSSFIPTTRRRSYARAYHDQASRQANYRILTGHTVTRVELSDDLRATGVDVENRSNLGKIQCIHAAKEVILAAGTMRTPRLLQLSGLGNQADFHEAGITTRVDLPGVGMNLADHPQSRIACKFENDMFPNPDTYDSNSTYRDEVHAEFNSTHMGPLTIRYGNAFVALPVPLVHSSALEFLTSLSAQKLGDYLPPSIPPEVLAGFAAQKMLLQSQFSSPDAAVLEVPFSGQCTRMNILLKPLSRGYAGINTTSPRGPPVMDFRAFTNPLDLDLAIEAALFTRRYLRTPTLSQLRPVETHEWANVTADERELLEEWVRMTGQASSLHAVGTAAMMPRELGGVVDSELGVYGVKKLSVVDASVQPMVVGAHLVATVYAVAEKAADLIKARYAST